MRIVLTVELLLLLPPAIFDLRVARMFAYDEGRDGAINYFDQNFSGFWTQNYSDIHAAMSAAYGEHDAMLAKSESHDAALMAELTTKYGAKYAQLCALSYRQTLAATKLVWNHNLSTPWNFLKEIRSVISVTYRYTFRASPSHHLTCSP